MLGAASHHGRLLIVNRSCAKESTGHGSPLPHLVHGGLGRAGGGEEMGGVRAVMHYLQRTALQGSPTTLGAVCEEYTKGGAVKEGPVHPFRKSFDELQIGDSILTHRRTITEADISNFAGISRDFFIRSDGRDWCARVGVRTPRGPRLSCSRGRGGTFCRSGAGSGAGELRTGKPQIYKTGRRRRHIAGSPYVQIKAAEGG